MRDRKLDRLFDRFRRRGDTAALAQVFDATAPELLGLAVHLVRDVGEGEDLVQQTFLTAIEKADRYEADRRLVPWLVGILVRHAHASRRKRARASDAELPDEGGGDDPSLPLEASELTDSIDVALERLPANYREVLEPYLLRGERPVDIARERGRSPGTVRVQIRRGLEELRRALPAGLTLGTGVLVGERSLAQVRTEVLRQAARSAGTTATLSATSLSSATLLGSLAMSQKLALAALAVSLLAVVAWFAQQGDLSLDDAAVEREAVAQLDPIERDDQTRPLRAAEVQSQPAEVEPSRVDLAGDRDPEEFAPETSAGVSGRIVDDLGAPVPGMPILLFQVHGDLFTSNLAAPFEGPLERGLRAMSWQPVVAEAETDEEGRFVLDGADAAGSHALGIDIGGGRPTLRLLERRLRSNEDVDLGTIQLEPVRRLTGRVIDADGQPVAGARVRAGNYPEPAHVLAGWRAGAKLIYGDGRRRGGTFELPAMLAGLIERLPVPTTETDSAGCFELDGAPLGVAHVFVDHPDHDWFVAQAPTQGEELGDLELPRPNRFQGRVVDESGAPVAGAEVRSGPGRGLEGEDDDDRIAVISTETTTDASGSFVLHGTGVPMVAARRGPGSPWTTVNQFLGAEDVVLAPTSTLAVQLSSRDGEPLTGAELSIVVDSPLSELEGALGSLPSQGTVEVLGEGRYLISELQPSGRYKLRVRVAGFALRTGRLKLDGPETSVEWTLDRAGVRSVKAIDLTSRAPIAGARMSLLLQGSEGGILTQARTDDAGLALLAGVPIEGESELVLRATHPAFATTWEDFDVERESTTVELSDQSSALFSLSVLGSPPLETLMITVEPQRHGDGISLDLPLLELSDGAGRARFGQLAAGTCEYTVSTRFLDADILSLMQTQPDVKPLAQGTFEVRKGQETRVQVDLPPEFFEESAPAAGTGIEGRIRVTGLGDLQLQVGLIRLGSWEIAGDWTDIGPGGGYSFVGLQPGDYQLIVLRKGTDSPNPQAIAAERVALARDRVLRKDIELAGESFLVSVMTESGAPAGDARLSAYALEELDGQPLPIPTDEPGVYELAVWEEGKYMLHAISPTEGVGVTRIEVTGARGERFEVRLARGVPCAGTIQLPKSTSAGMASFNVYNIDGEELSINGQLEFTGGATEFEFVGLVPGDYRGGLGFEGDSSWLELMFTVPEGGDRGLQIDARKPSLDPGPAPVVDSDDR